MAIDVTDISESVDVEPYFAFFKLADTSNEAEGPFLFEYTDAVYAAQH